MMSILRCEFDGAPVVLHLNLEIYRDGGRHHYQVKSVQAGMVAWVLFFSFFFLLDVPSNLSRVKSTSITHLCCGKDQNHPIQLGIPPTMQYDIMYSPVRPEETLGAFLCVQVANLAAVSYTSTNQHEGISGRVTRCPVRPPTGCSTHSLDKSDFRWAHLDSRRTGRRDMRA